MKVLGIAVAVGLVLAFGVYLSLATGSGEKVIPALLTFVGVVVPVMVKNHVDTRSEHRLRLDAAMEAGKLLSPTDGGAPSPAAVASGLLALADLDRSKLAVAILLDLWAKDAVASEVAVLIIEKALASDDDTTAQIAAEVLCQNAHKLDPRKPAHWPGILDSHWVPHATEKTKILLIESLVEMSTNSTLAAPSINALRAFAVRIVFIHDHEVPGHFRKCIAGLAGAIAPALAPNGPRSDGQAFDFYDGHTHIDGERLCKVAEDFRPNPDTFFAKITEIRREAVGTWALQCRDSGVAQAVGAMASASCQDAADPAVLASR